MSVEIKDGKEILYTIGQHISTYYDTHYESVMNKDKYKELLGDGQARVSIGMDERIGGPHYSSISIRVNISVNCDQSEKVIDETTELLSDEAMAYLEGHYEAAVERLREHLNHLYPSNRN